jgi:hypothetical protein
MDRNCYAILAIAVIVGSCSAPAAAETWLTSTITSYHSRCPSCYNQRNFGLGGEVGYTKHSRLVFGYYENSQYHTSVYGGLNYSPWQWGPARFGATFGLVTGYEWRPIVPMIVPGVQIEGKTAGLNIGALASKHTGLVLGLQLKLKFKE